MKAIFLGGDVRQKYACDFLNINNIVSECYTSFNSNSNIHNLIMDASVIALPIPIIKSDNYLNTIDDGKIEIYDILSLLREHHILFGGRISDPIKNYLLNHNIKYIDYMDIESFQIKNALLSAEGAIYYAQGRINSGISDLEIAIFGFGRIGKILAYLLHTKGAKITVFARKESDFAWCQLIGLKAVKILGNIISSDILEKNYDIVFNTIPYRIIDERFAKNINTDTIIIDLASYPYGMDESIAKKYNLKYYHELGIPGRYAPESAGKIIGEIILNYI